MSATTKKIIENVGLYGAIGGVLLVLVATAIVLLS